MRVSAILAGLALAVVMALALVGLRRLPIFGGRQANPGAGDSAPPQVVLTVRTEGDKRVGSDLVFLFSVVNAGQTPVKRLHLRADGSWSAFQVRLVDVDGSFETEGGMGWFLLGQGIQPGAGREPIVKIVPRAAGTYHFEFRAFDGDLALSDPSGQPAAAALDVVIGP